MQNLLPLILLHGALGSASQFDSITLKLKLFYDVHVLNFEGHGGLGIPSDSFSLEMFRNSILKYMEANNIYSAHIFGYSMGGYVAVSMATEYPDRVLSIMTLATKFDWTESTAEAEKRMLDPSTIFLKVPQLAEALKLRHAPENWENVVHKTSEFISSLGKHPLGENDFHKVICKVQIMVGDRDKMVSVPESLNICKMFSSGSFVVLHDTPHPFESVNESKLIHEFRNFFHY